MTSYVSPVAFTTVAQSIPPNVFADMDRKVAAAVAGGADVIDLAKGNPDAFPADFIRDVAKQAVDDPANARYSPFDGKPSFLQAAEHWYRNTYDVDLDWRTQLFAVEGAVDGLAALFAVLVSEGDAVAYADPYYPSYHCMTLMSRAEEILLPSLAECGFLPDLDAVPGETWDRVKVLILNYPNNPTGAQAPREFLERAIELAHEHRFVIVQDFAYAGLGVRNQQISILSLPDAFDVTVEVCSLSKMYAMAGWRAGFIAGNDDIVSHVKQYHYQMGSMVTGNVQDAGTVALQSDQECVAELASRYALRRQIVADGLRDAGLDVFDSDGGIYAWVHAPEGLTGERFADLLLERAAVAALPGTCFGKVGVDYVRFSLLKSEDQLREAVRRIAAVL
ncbi:pyridoxal phosphate-dependent aminotransferase [Bifidobacterium dentium]|uniref:pyridoxal phosphate-dependent aminotransferase n=1 Tax=Bifidobacterium dentium TaxID=1689 RepID=UPI0022E0836E|nr:aminotransferase class I/II-fold pyridoxal phosphate-dependent enzyme [Bifidobacterium dentium]